MRVHRFFRSHRRPRVPTLRELGAQAVGQRGQELAEETRRLAEALMQGSHPQEGLPDNGPDYAQLVQRARDLSMSRLANELVMLEVVERAQQLGLLRELETQYPGALRDTSQRGSPQPASGHEQPSEAEE